MAEGEQKKCVMSGVAVDVGEERPRVVPPEAILSAAAILAAEDSRTLAVMVPEWGGYVYVRRISGRERDRFEASIARDDRGGRNLLNFRARFAAMVLSDKDGKALFVESDVEKLAEKSAAALDRILDAGLRLNRMTPADIELLAKNSESDLSADSGSDSP